MPAWPPALIRSITLHRNDYHFCFAVVLDFRLGFPVDWSWSAGGSGGSRFAVVSVLTW
jgi:hypothetical protein